VQSAKVITIKSKDKLKVHIGKTTFITDGVPDTFSMYNYRLKLSDLVDSLESGDKIWADAVHPTTGEECADRRPFETGRSFGGDGFIGCQTFGKAAWAILMKAAKVAAKKGKSRKK
jgi:hypothetical protein